MSKNTNETARPEDYDTDARALYRNACQYPTAGRFYFYDIDTREEVASFPNNGRRECGIRDGARYMDTMLAAVVVDHDARVVRHVTAADFPGRRIAVKEWFPRGHWKGQAHDEKNEKWAFLVDERNGWCGNRADTGTLATRTLGPAARAEEAHG